MCFFVQLENIALNKGIQRRFYALLKVGKRILHIHFKTRIINAKTLVPMNWLNYIINSHAMKSIKDITINNSVVITFELISAGTININGSTLVETSWWPYLYMDRWNSMTVFEREEWLINLDGSVNKMVVAEKVICCFDSICLTKSSLALSARFLQSVFENQTPLPLLIFFVARVAITFPFTV